MIFKLAKLVLYIQIEKGSPPPKKTLFVKTKPLIGDKSLAPLASFSMKLTKLLGIIRISFIESLVVTRTNPLITLPFLNDVNKSTHFDV